MISFITSNLGRSHCRLVLLVVGLGLILTLSELVKGLLSPLLLFTVEMHLLQRWENSQAWRPLVRALLGNPEAPGTPVVT